MTPRSCAASGDTNPTTAGIISTRGLTSHACASSASARRLPDADRRLAPTPRRETTRFPNEELSACQGLRPRGTHARVAFRRDKSVGAPIDNFAARWLAYVFHCRRRTARGRCGSLFLHRREQALPTPRRPPGALSPDFPVISHSWAVSPIAIGKDRVRAKLRDGTPVPSASFWATMSP
jgi:hypothetical protein